MSLSQWVWAPSPKSHLNPQLMGETWSGEFAPPANARYSTHHSWVGWCGDDVRWKNHHIVGWKMI